MRSSIRQRTTDIDGGANHSKDSDDPNHNGVSNRSNNGNGGITSERDRRNAIIERRLKRANGRGAPVSPTKEGSQSSVQRKTQRQIGTRSPTKKTSVVKSTPNSTRRKKLSSSTTSPSIKQVDSRRSNEEFFSSSSSSSDEDDESDDDDDDGSDSSEESSSVDFHHRDGSSEFDKAARSGQGPSHSELPQQKQPVGKNKSNLRSRPPKTTASSSSSQPTSPSNRSEQSANQHRQHRTQLPPQYEQSGDDGIGDEDNDPLSSGVLPDALMTMRQKIESLTLFDSDMMKLVGGGHHPNHPAYSASMNDDPILQETRESLKRSSQQSISAAVLVSLAHKRYERRRLAAMEIEKVVRSLVQQGDEQLERVRAILLLLSDDYVRSTSEDARKGGVVALAASAIGLKKAPDTNPIAHECRDLILASVVHACQDHSQRVRYYATESLFNVIKVIPSLAVQHFFILFEILRSLYADVDVDVKSGAELLDKKLKEVIVGAMNSGQFTADACVPVFARFVYMRNKATKRLTLTWLQELTEKLIGAPILEFLHLFLTGIFDMIADPTLAIRQSALAFLQSVLPKLLDNHVVEEAIDDFQSAGIKVDFDKILQSLVTTMEHPDPFVRKIAMYWMSRIVKAHIGGDTKKFGRGKKIIFDDVDKQSAATVSVRNSLPHVLPGILLSIGDTFNNKSNVRDYFLPDTNTHTLADQTNACLQEAVRKDGQAYVQHLDSFIVALREELDSPGGVNARNPPAIDRRPYRMDVKHDGTGIESQGWFRTSTDTKEENVDSMMMSRLCALHWIIVLYESVVPDVLKADYAREFIIPIIDQLVDDPPEKIIFKSLEVLAKITIPVKGEPLEESSNTLSGLVASPSWMGPEISDDEREASYPMDDSSVGFALDILDRKRSLLRSRDRQVFSALIQLFGYNVHLIGELSRVIAYMCRLQPPEFVFVSFAVEVNQFVRRKKLLQKQENGSDHLTSQDFQFVSAFIQQMCLVLLNSKETIELRNILKDCIGYGRGDERDRRRSRLFHILLHSFSHNLIAATSLCLWGGACRTASLFLKQIDPLDISLVFLLELDKLVEMIERPLFRHLHVRMLERDQDPLAEGSGAQLFQVLKSLLMLIPQSACYNILRDRLVSTSRYRQSVIANSFHDDGQNLSNETQIFVSRVLSVRRMHCETVWETIRAESLESIPAHRRLLEAASNDRSIREEGSDRRKWLGYTSVEDETQAKAKYKQLSQSNVECSVCLTKEETKEDFGGSYNEFPAFEDGDFKELVSNDKPPANVVKEQPSSTAETAEENKESDDQDEEWKAFWSKPDTNH